MANGEWRTTVAYVREWTDGIDVYAYAQDEALFENKKTQSESTNKSGADRQKKKEKSAGRTDNAHV